ncbi:MAG: TatD family hydrolase [Saprospiraceae bacterium]
MTSLLDFLFGFEFLFSPYLCPMKLIDTHTHLYLPQFDEDRAEMMARANEAGITQMFLPGIDSEHVAAMLQLEKDYPGICLAMPGLHPCSVGENVEAELAIVKSMLEENRKWCAIGEIGLDLYWDKTFVEQQKFAFRQQIQWAKEYHLPIVIHSRDATQECIDLVKSEKDERLKGVFHCFGGSLEEARQIMELDFMLGIGGVLTFKKAGLDLVMPDVPMEYIVLETDSPYLAPVPFRGKRNESSYLLYVAQKLAEIKGVSVAEVAEITTANALKLFNQTPG